MAKLICQNCKRKCRGDVLRVLNQYYHKHCFTCSNCRKSLESGGFFIKDGRFYCQADYQKYFSAKCRACSRDLVGEIVTVLNYSFHRDCFKCATCSLAFNPGDRVTVWKENFYCPKCIKLQSIPSPPTSLHKFADMALSPISITDDEGCISAADGSPSDVTSPEYPTAKTVTLDERKISNSSPGNHLCISSTSHPQTSKSILRKTGDSTRTSSRDRGHLSTDSGLGEKLFDSRVHEDISLLSIPEQTNCSDSYSRVPATPSTNMSVNVSRQSLNCRVPNSDYGRFLNQSYMHLSQPMLTQTGQQQFKRGGSTTMVHNFSQPRHFHIPQTKSRFLPPGTSATSILFGRTNSTTFSPDNTSHTSKTASTHPTSLSKDVTKSASELYAKTNGHASPSVEADNLAANENEVTMEVRRLACYPSGHVRDKTVPPPIERYDWPAPPATAVVLAEMMRERRCRQQERQGINGVTRTGGEDYQSQELLSIDESFGGRADESGIGKVILREDVEQKRQFHSQVLDPVLASRSPNAAFEPNYKPRFSAHQFACQPIRPGYTGGRLSSLEKTTSLPASAFISNCGRQQPTCMSPPPSNLGDGDRGTKRIPASYRPYYRSVHTLSTTNGLSTTLNQSPDMMPNGEKPQCNGRPNLLCPPAPKEMFPNYPPASPLIVPYDQLKTYRVKTPKNIDRTTLETHLSEEEFQRVFQLSRSAFYHLPEWKRNDLKRRVQLF